MWENMSFYHSVFYIVMSIRERRVKAMKKIILLSIFVFMLTYSTKASAIIVTNSSGQDLIDNILGSGITTSGVTTIGIPGQQGTFVGGLSSGIGIDAGIIMTTGLAANAAGPNTSGSTTFVTGTGPNNDLSLLSGGSTFDQNVLSFDFQSAGGDLFFNYVFASEEYNEYTNTQFNDVFAFFVDDVNIALIPGTTDPVSINNVNGGNPLGTGASNPDLFNNNDFGAGAPFDIEYDGFTDVFTAQALGLAPGAHNMTLAIADNGDFTIDDKYLDSAVFIQAGSFSYENANVEPVPTPEPATIALLGIGLAGFAGGAARRKRKKKMINDK